MSRGGEENGIRIPAKVMTEHVQGADRVAEGAGHVGRGTSLYEIGPESFILALLGVGGFKEEAATLT